MFDIEPYYRAYIARIDLSGGLSVCHLTKQSFVEFGKKQAINYTHCYVLVNLVVFYYVSLPFLLIEFNNINIKEKSSQNIPGINR